MVVPPPGHSERDFGGSFKLTVGEPGYVNVPDRGRRQRNAEAGGDEADHRDGLVHPLDWLRGEAGLETGLEHDLVHHRGIRVGDEWFAGEILEPDARVVGKGMSLRKQRDERFPADDLHLEICRAGRGAHESDVELAVEDSGDLLGREQLAVQVELLVGVLRAEGSSS